MNSLFNRPPTAPDAGPDGSSGDTRNSLQLREAQVPPPIHKAKGRRGVLHLFLLCYPPAILGAVIAIIVNPVYGGPHKGLGPHVAEERLERIFPLPAHLDPPATIPGPLRTLAPRYHSIPRTILRRGAGPALVEALGGVPVFEISSAVNLAVVAPARLRRLTDEALQQQGADLPARTKTCSEDAAIPRFPKLFSPVEHPLYREPSKLCPNIFQMFFRTLFSYHILGLCL